MERTDELSLHTSGMQVNVCLNYGGRDEIIRAARSFAEDCAAGSNSPESLTDERFSGLLYTAGIPDPDLIIRPSGEIRTSNFLLWQSAYAEYYFTEVLWPDFNRNELYRAIAAYQGRSRRFGGIGGAV
jgi:undecaprenyl diphosphate synthase